MITQEDMVQNLRDGSYYIRTKSLDKFISKYGVDAALCLDLDGDGKWSVFSWDNGSFPDKWYGVTIRVAS